METTNNEDENVSLFKQLVGKPLLEVTKILNSSGKKYRIERPGQQYTNEIMLGRIRLRVDANNVITSVMTG